MLGVYSPSIVKQSIVLTTKKINSILLQYFARYRSTKGPLKIFSCTTRAPSKNCCILYSEFLNMKKILHHAQDLPVDTLVKGDPLGRQIFNYGVSLLVELRQHPSVHVVGHPLVLVGQVGFVVRRRHAAVAHHRPRRHPPPKHKTAKKRTLAKINSRCFFFCKCERARVPHRPRQQSN